MIKHLTTPLLAILLAVSIASIARAQEPEHVFDMDAGTMTDCGTERWAVKTLSDPDTVSILFEPAGTNSVTDVSQWPKLEFKKDLPRQTREYFVVNVVGFLYAYKIEDDGDIHMLLRDPATDSSIVTEIPSPDCPEVKLTSRWADYTVARQWLIDSIGKPTSSFKYLPTPRLVVVTGVPFADYAHGQTGMAANNWEIHPVMSVEFAIPSAVDERKLGPGKMDLTHK